jgi:hypothetical protein
MSPLTDKRESIRVARLEGKLAGWPMLQAEENARDNGPGCTGRPKAEVKSVAEKRGPKTKNPTQVRGFRLRQQTGS